MTRIVALFVPASFLLLALAAVPAAAQVQPPQVAYLKFNEGAGSATADSALPGTGASPGLLGASGWNTATPRLGAASLVVGPGPGDVGKINSPLALSGSWTIECWFRDQNPYSPYPYSYANVGPCGWLGTYYWSDYDLFADGSAGGLRCTVYDTLCIWQGTNTYERSMSLDLGGFWVEFDYYGIIAGGWNHLAFVHDAAAATITSYMNGIFSDVSAVPPGLAITASSASGLGLGGDGLANNWTGEIDEFRIWNVARSQAQIVADMNVELNVPASDMALQSIDAPLVGSLVSPCAPRAASETVAFTVANYGSMVLAAGAVFGASFALNGGAAVGETFVLPTALSLGQTASFSFAATLDLSQGGERAVAVTLAFSGDQDPLNDSKSVTIAPGVGLVSSFPYAEDFDLLPSGLTTTPPAGWTQDAQDGSGGNADWFFRDGPTPSVTTGPPADHSTGLPGQGHYAHTEDSGADLAQVNLLSPCLDLGGLANPRLVFWVHSLNAQALPTSMENFISVDLLLPNGSIVADLIGPVGHLGAGWQRLSCDLPPFSGITVQLRFRGRSDGGGELHDLAIDDILIFDALPGIGQAPQPGLATLDLNNAQSPLLGSVSSGDNGPYSTTATVGGPLVYSLGGVPGQPVILLFGSLNPVAATFPMIGQMDIGGLPDPMTGIPMGIQVLGNGFTPLDFIDLLFVIGSSGQTTLSFVLPPLPPGTIGAFQTANATGPALPLALSNAVELTIL